MKEPWEIMRDHEFAVVTAQCRSLGLPEPTLTSGGFKHNTDTKTLWRRCKGKEFHNALNELGHDSPILEKCKCFRS